VKLEPARRGDWLFFAFVVVLLVGVVLFATYCEQPDPF